MQPPATLPARDRPKRVSCSFSRARRQRTAGLDRQKAAEEEELERQRQACEALLRELFGTAPVEHIKYRALDPSIYIQFVDLRIQTFSTIYFHPALRALGLDVDTAATTRMLWTLLTLIAHLTKDNAANSIDIVVSGLCANYHVAPTSGLPLEDKASLRLAVFAALSILTMLFKPTLEPTKDCYGMILSHERRKAAITTNRNLSSESTRPVGRLLHGFRNLLPEFNLEIYSPVSPPDSPADLIHTSTLSYSVLTTVGKVRIAWTDSIGSHLEFNALTRTLFLFSMPTVCALGILSEDGETLWERILEDYFDDTSNKEFSTKEAKNYAATSLRREIILSYRVIFGQDRKSRDLFDSTRSATAVQHGASLSAIADSNFSTDPLLRVLCTKACSELHVLVPHDIWPDSARDVHGDLQEQDVYSKNLDFPVLGARLLKLEAFSLRQSPTKFRHVWRDFRSPFQWYTFWAVVIFAAVTLVFTMLQTLLAIAALAVSIRQLKAAPTA
ncbi:hypothetical protein BKA64DRAFT_54773 [Cadophora sp. MPI-SDFR-AT-0126]|nr:hypothetical protein BKA64DRAFT_54773 [Leotiomycetes sp. MPI-SDFR-AT-0126]